MIQIYLILLGGLLATQAPGVLPEGRWMVGTSAHLFSAPIRDFNATPNTHHSVTISWTSTPGVQAQLFTIERSSNGKDFESWRTLEGPGSSTTLQEYLEVDPTPLPEATFYRIALINEKGETSYSEIRVARTRIVKKEVELMVLPYTDKGDDDIERKRDDEVLTILKDEQGNEIYTKALLYRDQDTYTGIATKEKLPKGKYVIIGSSREGLDGSTLFVFRN